MVRVFSTSSADSTDLKSLHTLPLQHHRRNRSHPVIHKAVALEALRRESLRKMIRILRFLEVIHVTARALGRQSLPIKRTHRPHLVARVAIHHGVRPDQREAVLVLINVVDGDLPTRVAVARITLRGVPAAMDIGVAVLALVMRLREDQVGMAIRAADFGMQTTQGESRLPMIELRDCADRLPSDCRVAVLAGDIQFSVRTMGLFLRGGLPAIDRECAQMQDH